MRDTILFGDCRETLKQFDEPARMCVTSPPYFGLRDYGTATWIGGDPNCNHMRDSKVNPSNCITGHKNHDKMAGVGDAIYKTVCPKCGAVRQDDQIGLEETPEEYIDQLVNVFKEVRNVLQMMELVGLILAIVTITTARKRTRTSKTKCLKY